MIQNVGPVRIPEAGLQPSESWAAPPRISTFWNASGAAISAGDVVSLHLSVLTYGLGSAVRQKPAAATDNPLIVGVCYEDSDDDTMCKVQIAGIFGDVSAVGAAASGVNVDGAVAANDVLIGDAATAGRLITIAAFAVTNKPVAVALEADAANRARCLLLNPLGL